MSKERPILFSGPMVRAILDGRKTQTRRIMKPQPHTAFLARGVIDIVPQWPHQDGVRWFMSDGCSELIKCPYGAPGDHLWVRETHFYSGLFRPASRVRYRANDMVRIGKGEFSPAVAKEPKWRPSIHMPRWASRITLGITAVRVERLQDISEEDALAEGVTIQGDACIAAHVAGAPWTPAKMEFWDLWKTINGAESWDANPWVWVIKFKRV